MLTADGLILTNEHVVRHGSEITVVFHDGSEHRVESIVSDRRLDLAVLRIDRHDLRPLVLSTRPVSSGSAVVAIGCLDLGGGRSYRLGVVTNHSASLQNALDPERRRDYSELIESTARLEAGFSGGPLLDAAGRLIGLNVAVRGRSGSDQCRGYAIPFSEQNRLTAERLARSIGPKVVAAQYDDAVVHYQNADARTRYRGRTKRHNGLACRNATCFLPACSLSTH